MISKKSAVFLLVSILLLVSVASAIRLVNPVSAEQAPHFPRTDRFQRCEAEAGFFWVDTTSGNVWWADQGNGKWVYGGHPEGAEPGPIGTYTPCKNDGGPGLFVINTATGKVWRTDGNSWDRLDKGEARGGRIGTYVPYNNKDGAGIHILSHKTGEGWWTNGNTWVSLDEAAGEDYVPRDSKDDGITVEGELLTKEYVQTNIARTSTRQQDRAEDTSDFLREELEKAKQRLYEVEEELVAVQENSGALDSLNSEKEGLMSGLTKLRELLIEVELSMPEADSELQSAIEAVEGQPEIHSSTFYTDPAIISLQSRSTKLETKLDELSASHGDEAPKTEALRKQIRQIQEKLEQAKVEIWYRDTTARQKQCEATLNKLKVKKGLLNEKINEYNHLLRELPRRQMELARLQREMTVIENNYLMLLQRLYEVELLDRPPEASLQDMDKSDQFTLKISNPESGMTYGAMLLDDQVTSMETFLNSLQRATPTQKQMLIIQSGRKVSHDQIVEVMDYAKSAGIKKIGFAMAGE